MEFTGRLSALKHPLYRRYWLGSCGSVGAAQLQIMAQGWLVYELTGSALMLGYLGAAASLPSILMTLFGGVMADAMNKKWLIAIACILSAFLLGLLAFLDFTDQVHAWHVITIAGCLAFISGFDWPTRQAIFPALIEPADMMSAVALNAIIWQATRMMMPAVGGLIIAGFDTWLVFALCSAGWVGMLIVIVTLNIKLPKSASRGSALSQIKDGVSFIFDNNLFRVFIGLSFISMAFGNCYQQMMPAFAALLDTAETGYGLLISAGGVGSVVGTILIGDSQHSRQLGKRMLGSAMISTLFVYLLATVTGLFPSAPFAMILAMGCIFGAAVFGSIYMIMSMTVLQLKVPDHLRGRVMGIHGICYSLMPLGGLLVGALSATLSVPGAIALILSLYLAAAVWVWFTQDDIRELSGAHHQGVSDV